MPYTFEDVDGVVVLPLEGGVDVGRQTGEDVGDVPGGASTPPGRLHRAEPPVKLPHHPRLSTGSNIVLGPYQGEQGVVGEGRRGREERKEGGDRGRRKGEGRERGGGEREDGEGGRREGEGREGGGRGERGRREGTGRGDGEEREGRGERGDWERGERGRTGR